MSILTREEEREPCRERGERKRRESEGVRRAWGEGDRDGDRICHPPFPTPSPRTLLRRASATCGAVSGMTHKQSEAGRRGVIKRTGQSGGSRRVKHEDRTAGGGIRS